MCLNIYKYRCIIYIYLYKLYTKNRYQNNNNIKHDKLFPLFFEDLSCCLSFAVWFLSFCCEMKLLSFWLLSASFWRGCGISDSVVPNSLVSTDSLESSFSATDGVTEGVFEVGIGDLLTFAELFEKNKALLFGFVEIVDLLGVDVSCFRLSRLALSFLGVGVASTPFPNLLCCFKQIFK